MSADSSTERIDLAREEDVRLGALLVRPSTRQVKFGGKSETLQPRIMQVLVALARRRGQVVSRDDLVELCWEGRAVGEDAISRCIQQLRKLGEASGAFRLETIPRVGYRMQADEASGDNSSAAPAVGSAGLVTPRRARIIAAAAAAGALLVAGVVWWTNNGGADISPPSRSVAFFGFTAADGDPRSARIAADATDQTFAEFTRMRVDPTAKADTLDIPAAGRLAKAKALGAAYALSGEVRIEGGEARFAIRLEDAVTSATLWESAEATPIDRPFYSPPKQAAFRAAGNTRCVVGIRAELSRENPEALQAIGRYCSRPLSQTEVERGVLILRSLAEFEPRSAFFQAYLALQLATSTGYLGADLRTDRLREVDALLAEAQRLDPGYPLAIATSEYAHSIRGGSPLESERMLAPAQGGASRWGEGFLWYRRGLNLLGVGRTEEAVSQLREAEEAQPSYTQLAAFRASGLASLGKAADAGLLFEQVFANQPDQNLVWSIWARAAVLEGVGDAEAVLAAAPTSEPRASVACWRLVLAAKRAGKPGPPTENLRDCGSIISILAALGRVDKAFDRYSATGLGRDYPTLFAPSARAMREHKRFVPLMKDLGLWDYWIETGSRPDVCDLSAEREFEVCAQLRTVQAK